MAVYVTGDTHRDVDFGKIKKFKKENPELGKDDYLIITGDFGGVWNEKTIDKDLKPYEELGFNVLFVDGNHENFPLLNSFPCEIWNGGKIHRIRDNIIHLMRGQIFNLEGKTFFTFGGATSLDKCFRREGISWWSEEVPSEDEFEKAKENLKAAGNKVDYIITHSCDAKSSDIILFDGYHSYHKIYPENIMLTYFEENTDYLHWYFGHFHLDMEIGEKKTLLYQNILKILP